MKIDRLGQLTALALVLLVSVAGPAAATEEPESPAVPAPAQAPEPDVAEEAPPAPALDELLMPQPEPVCGCRDVCRNDAQCELIFGPGSQCVPVGPCACKECQATM